MCIRIWADAPGYTPLPLTGHPPSRAMTGASNSIDVRDVGKIPQYRSGQFRRYVSGTTDAFLHLSSQSLNTDQGSSDDATDLHNTRIWGPSQSLNTDQGSSDMPIRRTSQPVCLTSQSLNTDQGSSDRPRRT